MNLSIALLHQFFPLIISTMYIQDLKHQNLANQTNVRFFLYFLSKKQKSTSYYFV
jgi:hypothetical protein